MELDCSFLQVHKLARILTNYFFEIPKFGSLLSGTAVLLGLGIHKYQDQIQESTGQITQSIKDAFEPMGLYLGEAKGKILVLLGDVKEKVMSLPSAFWTTDVQENETSTQEISTRSMADRIKDFVPMMGNAEPVSGE